MIADYRLERPRIALRHVISRRSRHVNRLPARAGITCLDARRRYAWHDQQGQYPDQSHGQSFRGLSWP